MAFKKFTSSEEMLKPDARYNSKLVSKFINCLMWQGKKTVAMKIFYSAMDEATKKMKEVPPLELFGPNLLHFRPDCPTNLVGDVGTRNQSQKQVPRPEFVGAAFGGEG